MVRHTQTMIHDNRKKRVCTFLSLDYTNKEEENSEYLKEKYKYWFEDTGTFNLLPNPTKATTSIY